MDNKYMELSLSFSTLVLVIIAVIIFIKTGGSLIFYIVSTITVVVGLVNMWKISRSGEEHIEKRIKSIERTIHKPRIKSKPKSNINKRTKKHISKSKSKRVSVKK